MAKTSTRTKAAKVVPKKKPARKADNKATPPVGIAPPTELRLIPLDQLSLSPRNVRQVPASATDDAELLASIRENGIKQNLVVCSSGKNVFRVNADGRRLKLARVAPEIIAQFRTNELTVECVMAFTLTDDHERQLVVWNIVKDSYQVHPQSIKCHLTETVYSAGSSLGRFVGIEAYETAGGLLLRDLFDD